MVSQRDRKTPTTLYLLPQLCVTAENHKKSLRRTAETPNSTALVFSRIQLVFTIIFRILYDKNTIYDKLSIDDMLLYVIICISISILA